MPSFQRIAPVDYPLREPLVNQLHEKVFIPIEDIPSPQGQSTSSNLSKKNPAEDEVLYPKFMERVTALASTLEYMTINEQYNEEPGCCHGILEGLKTLLGSDKEFMADIETENDQALLFWHRGQKVATTVPKSETDYVVARFGKYWHIPHSVGHTSEFSQRHNVPEY